MKFSSFFRYNPGSAYRVSRKLHPVLHHADQQYTDDIQVPTQLALGWESGISIQDLPQEGEFEPEQCRDAGVFEQNISDVDKVICAEYS